VRELLKLIAIDPDRSGQPLGTDPAYREPVWEHVRIYPLSYDRLRLMEEEVHEDEEEATRAARTRSAQLWVGLARAALAVDTAALGDGSAVADDEDTDVDPTVVAQAIDRHDRDDAYDQVIVGYMLQIADELKSGKTTESVALKRRVSKLVSNLDQDTLSGLLNMGGDAGQRRQFLLNASEGMAVEAVVDLVTAASESEGQNISHSMLRMLQKLARHADRDGGRRREVADSSVREQISSLIKGWTLNDPNPDAYREALQRMSVAAPVFSVAANAIYIPEPQRLVEMALELDVFGEPVERAVHDLLLKGRIEWLLEIATKAEAPVASQAIIAQVATLDRVSEVLEAETLNAALFDRLVAEVGVEAATPMLDALMDAESSQTRRILIDRIGKLGREAGPHIVTRLDDQRWFVRRNMLTLIGELPTLPPGFDPLNYANDSDGRVRREALRIMLRSSEARERAICMGLTDDDDHCVRLALTAAGHDCPEPAIPLLVSRATGGSNSDQRVTAIRVLGDSGAPAGLEVLIKIVALRKSLFGAKLPPKTKELLAALTALSKFPEDKRARAALSAAARSRDPEILQAIHHPQG
jgi:hypothetical protein